MKLILNWVAGARWRKSVSHCVESIMPYAAGSLLFWNFWCGSAMVIAWFYSREVCQRQMRAKEPGTSTVTVWNVGYLPWQWDFWSAMDVVFPSFSSLVVSLIFYFYR